MMTATLLYAPVSVQRPSDLPAGLLTGSASWDAKLLQSRGRRKRGRPDGNEAVSDGPAQPSGGRVAVDQLAFQGRVGILQAPDHPWPAFSVFAAPLPRQIQRSATVNTGEPRQRPPTFAEVEDVQVSGPPPLPLL